MNLEHYWHTKHLYYSKKDWMDQPSLFGQFALSYFPKSGKILDLGAGQGCDSRFFAKLNYKVISADLSETALEFSKRRAIGEGVPGIEFLRLDMSSGELPFADETFDVVYASLSLHYFDEETTNLIFKEIYRILKPGGILAYITNPISDPQTKTYKKIDECFFEDPERLKKRYFTVDYAKQKAKGLFEILLANDQGKALDPKKPGNLMQFIGKKK